MSCNSIDCLLMQFLNIILIEYTRQFFIFLFFYSNFYLRRSRAGIVIVCFRLVQRVPTRLWMHYLTWKWVHMVAKGHGFQICDPLWPHVTSCDHLWPGVNIYPIKLFHSQVSTMWPSKYLWPGVTSCDHLWHVFSITLILEAGYGKAICDQLWQNVTRCSMLYKVSW